MALHLHLLLFQAHPGAIPSSLPEVHLSVIFLCPFLSGDPSYSWNWEELGGSCAELSRQQQLPQQPVLLHPARRSLLCQALSFCPAAMGEFQMLLGLMLLLSYDVITLHNRDPALPR